MELGTPTDSIDLEALFATIEAADGTAALTEYQMMRRGSPKEAAGVVATVDGAAIG